MPFSLPDECQQKYGNANVWRYCCEVFDYLNIAALIDGRIFCVHGGLSPELTTIDQIQTINRVQEIPHQGPLCGTTVYFKNSVYYIIDLVWSDPEELESGSWAVSQRGAGFLFGHRIVSEFNRINNLVLVCRAHQLVQEGYKFMFPEKDLVTIWSAPNYCYRCGNVAAIMHVGEDLAVDESSFKIFDAVSGTELQQNLHTRGRAFALAYFQ